MSDQTSQSEPATPARRPRHGRRLLLGGAAVLALLAGALGVAKAVEEHHHGMWGMQGGVPVQMIEHRADRMLNRVAATPDQQAKVHAIIEAAAEDIKPLAASMKGTHEQLATLLTAPQIDRAPVEHLRAERVATMDQVSQRVSKAAEDAAEVLTPEQRVKLKAVMDEFQQQHHHD